MHLNPCGGTYGDGLGQVADEAAWWEAPATQIAGAVAERISGPTSPYSPGSYEYGDTGHTLVPTTPTAVAPLQTAGIGGFGTAGTLLLVGAVALLAWLA